MRVSICRKESLITQRYTHERENNIVTCYGWQVAISKRDTEKIENEKLLYDLIISNKYLEATWAKW